jgi:hypothetical protein
MKYYEVLLVFSTLETQRKYVKSENEMSSFDVTHFLAHEDDVEYYPTQIFVKERKNVSAFPLHKDEEERYMLYNIDYSSYSIVNGSKLYENGYLDTRGLEAIESFFGEDYDEGGDITNPSEYIIDSYGRSFSPIVDGITNREICVIPIEKNDDVIFI